MQIKEKLITRLIGIFLCVVLCVVSFMLTKRTEENLLCREKYALQEVNDNTFHEDAMYQLMDNYTLFYFQFVKKNQNGDKTFWTSMYNSTLHNNWSGLAFERLCLQHLEQIKKGLGFGGVISTAHSWRSAGAQIDLLIDRNDDIINICEMKYSKGKYALDAEEIQRMQNRVDVFQSETETNKSINLVLVTSNGVTDGSDVHNVHSVLTMETLFLS